METASLATTSAKLADLVAKCETDGPVIITRKGKPVAVLVAAPSNEDDFDNLILTHSPKFWAMLERARKSIEEGKGLTEKSRCGGCAERSPWGQCERATVPARMG